MRVASRLCGVALSLMTLAGSAQTTTAPAYDVISIRPNKTLSHSTHVGIHDGIFSASNLTLKELIESAYDLKTDAQIVGLPAWASSASFDIEAKEDPEVAAAMEKKPDEEREKHFHLLMQSMLADRFKFVVHHETRTLATYALLVAKGGIKFKESDPNNEKNGSTNIHNTDMTATGISMDEFCDTLSHQVERQVTNKTELKGKYDIHLVWLREDAPVESKETTGVDSPPTMFTAVQEQLGLKLEASKGPVDTIVVDHLEEPSEN